MTPGECLFAVSAGFYCKLTCFVMSAELAYSFKATEKSDVYSFGVLLELVISQWKKSLKRAKTSLTMSCLKFNKIGGALDTSWTSKFCRLT
ncbi:hypothetical protein Bca4012_056809 [Brassica carinata]